MEPETTNMMIDADEANTRNQEAAQEYGDLEPTTMEAMMDDDSANEEPTEHYPEDRYDY